MRVKLFGLASDSTRQTAGRTQTGCRMLASVPRFQAQNSPCCLLLGFLWCPLKLREVLLPVSSLFVEIVGCPYLAWTFVAFSAILPSPCVQTAERDPVRVRPRAPQLSTLLTDKTNERFAGFSQLRVPFDKNVIIHSISHPAVQFRYTVHSACDSCVLCLPPSSPNRLNSSASTSSYLPGNSNANTVA